MSHSADFLVSLLCAGKRQNVPLFAEFLAPAAKAADGSSRRAHKAAAPQPRRQAVQPAIDSAAVLQRLTGVHMWWKQDRGLMPDSVSLLEARDLKHCRICPGRVLGCNCEPVRPSAGAHARRRRMGK